MRTKQILSIVILFLSMAFYAPSEVKAQRKDEMWVEVLNDGILMLLTPAIDVNCDPALAAIEINRPGECGRPLSAMNTLLVYGQNALCSADECRTDKSMGGIFAWGSLKPGDPVRLFDGDQLWIGVVRNVVYNVQPQTEFDCPLGKTCGVLCTGYGKRPGWVVVRIVYERGIMGEIS